MRLKYKQYPRRKGNLEDTYRGNLNIPGDGSEGSAKEMTVGQGLVG